LRGFVAEEQIAEFVLDHNIAHLEHLAGERERELIGQHWATRSGGRCLFAMVTQR